MTDKEIIKALECCSVDSPLSRKCKICPNFKQTMGCSFRTMQEALKLINRQKAEIERLNDKLDTAKREIVETIPLIEEDIKTSKAEAVKEFAERLKEKLHLNGAAMGFNCAIVNDVDIDNLVKEMVGADNG